MKKIILIVFPIIILIFLFVIFVFYKPNTKDDGVKYLLGVSFSNLSETEQASVYDALLKESRLDSEVSIIVTNASGSVYRQLKDLNKLYTLGVDAMLICADEGLVIKNEIAYYYGKVPIVLLEKSISRYNYDIYIGVDDYQMGYKAGQQIAQKLGNEECTVVEIKDAISIKTTQQRSKGFFDALESYNNIDIFSVFYDSHDNYLSDKLKSLYINNNDIKALFAHNMDVAIEAKNISKQMNMEDVFFVSINNKGFSDNYTMERMKNLDIVFSYNYYGEHAKTLIKKLINDKQTIVKKNILNVTLVNNDNLTCYIKNGDVTSNYRSDIGNDTVIGYIGNGKDSEYNTTAQNELKTFFNSKNVKFEIHTLNDEVSAQDLDKAQQNALKQVIDAGAKIVFFTLNSKVENIDLLKKARLSGVRVILLDEQLPYDIEYPLTYIGSDGFDEGFLAAEWIVDRVYSDKEDIVIAEISSNMDLLSTQSRREGFRSVINGYLRIKIAQNEYGYDSIDGGSLAMAKILDNHDDINLLYVHNQEMALGAIEELRLRGYIPGKDIKIIVNNAMKVSEHMLENNIINCIIRRKGTCATYIVEYFNDLYSGMVMNQKIILANEVVEQGE